MCMASFIQSYSMAEQMGSDESIIDPVWRCVAFLAE